jgi:transcription antitermination factor NusG
VSFVRDPHSLPVTCHEHPLSDAAPWYALTTKPQCEQSAASLLEQQGFEHFAPVVSTKRRWSDRFKIVSVPLFPRYLFARFTSEQRRAVLTTPGVLSIVTFGGVTLPISDEEISSMRLIVASGLPVESAPCLHVGDPIEIAYGALRGLTGVVVRFKDRDRVVVNVNALQRSIIVELDADQLRRGEMPRASGVRRLTPAQRFALC